MRGKPPIHNLRRALQRLDDHAHVRKLATCLMQSEEFREEVKDTIRQSKREVEFLWGHRDRLDYPTKARVSDLAIWVAKYETIVRRVEEALRERVQ